MDTLTSVVTADSKYFSRRERRVPDNTCYEQAKWLEENDDQLRKPMLREPRGYPPLCCNLIVPLKHPEAAAGFIIVEQVKYPMMSGGNTIAVATVLLETGMVPMQEPVTEFQLEAPAGLIVITVHCRDGEVQEVTFENVPAFSVHRDAVIDVPELGQVTVDMAWGHVLRDRRRSAVPLPRPRSRPGTGHRPHRGPDPGGSPGAASGGTSGLPGHRHDRPAVRAHRQPERRPDERRDGRQRAYRLGQPRLLDRRPRPAPLWHRYLRQDGLSARQGEELPLHQPFRHEDVLGTVYTGELVKKVQIGDRVGVVPTISGQAWIPGYSTYVLDGDDPFPNGFTGGDIWAAQKDTATA